MHFLTINGTPCILLALLTENKKKNVRNMGSKNHGFKVGIKKYVFIKNKLIFKEFAIFGSINE